MKKIGLFLLPFALLLMLMVPAYAAEGSITSLEASATTSAIKVSGTTDSDIAAVMVEVLKEEEPVCFYSFEVTKDRSFSGTISGLSLTAGTTYTVKAADYDGGSWKTVSVTVKETSSGTGSGSSANSGSTGSSVSESTAATASSVSSETETATEKTSAVNNKTDKEAKADVRPVEPSGDNNSAIESDHSDGLSEEKSASFEENKVNEESQEAFISKTEEVEGMWDEGSVNQVIDAIDEVLLQAEEAAKNESDTVHPTPEVVIELSEGAVLPEEIINKVAGKDVNIVIKKEGYYWTINGNDVDSSLDADIDFEVDIDAEVIPHEVIDEIAQGKATTQISLHHDGTLGMKATLTLELGDKGKEHTGEYANMYFYDSDETLVFQNAGLIDEEGRVSLSFAHASDYVLIFGEDMTPEETGSVVSNKPWIIGALIVAAIMLVGAGIFALRKREMD